MTIRIFMLWFLFFAWIIRQTIFVRKRLEFSAVDTFAGIQILIVFATLFILMVGEPSVTKILAALRRRPFFAMLAYYIFAALSATWSPRIEYSLYMAFEALVLIVLTLTLTSTAKSMERGERVFLSVVATIMMMIYLPRAIVTGTLLWHTNSYSICAMMLFCYAFAEYQNARGARRRWLLVFGAAGLLWLILGTSTGSNIAAVVGILSLVIVRKDLLRRVVLVALCLIVVTVVIGISFQYVGDLLAPGKGWEGVAHGANRVSVWEPVLNAVRKHPIRGFGFGIGTKFMDFNVKQYVTSAHNSILEVLINTGIIGLCIYLIGITRLLFATYRQARLALPGSAGIFAATVGAIVNSMSGAPIFGFTWTHVAFAFFVMYGFFEFSICGTGKKFQEMINNGDYSYIGPYLP